MKKIHTWLLTALFAGCVCSAQAQDEDEKPKKDDEKVEQKDEDKEEKKEESQEDTEETTEEAAKDEEKPEEPAPGTMGEEVLTDLNNPCGVAIQPGTGIVFVADSGNHQIVKVVDGKAEPVVTDFPKDVYGKGPKVNIGPLGLLFLDQNTLVVGGGGQPDGEELLRVYELPEDGKPIKADAMKDSFALEADEENGLVGEGNFYALAATPTAIYVTCNGDDTKGWVSRATVDGTTVSDYQRHLATKEATEVDAPVGVTVSPEGYLVVGQMGEINVPGDSLITFYDLEDDNEMLLNLKSGLHDISAIAYSKRGQMYVLDYAWADASQGGLFQILEDNDAESGMRAEKIMPLDKPTAMAFDADGSLYITVVGEAEDANSKGKLIKVTKEAGL